MTNVIIIIILIVILVPAVRTMITHMKGEGSCCGGPKEKVPKKKIKGTKLGEYLVDVEGMHCVNCKNRIEKNLNELDGIICKVNLEKKQAVVSCYQEVPEDIIIAAIEKLDFTVTGIHKKSA